jgi:hypothetical protein
MTSSSVWHAHFQLRILPDYVKASLRYLIGEIQGREVRQLGEVNLLHRHALSNRRHHYYLFRGKKYYPRFGWVSGMLLDRYHWFDVVSEET